MPSPYIRELSPQEKQRAYTQEKNKIREEEKARRSAENAPPSRRGPRRKKGKPQTNTSDDNSYAVLPLHPRDVRPQNRIFCRFFLPRPVPCFCSAPAPAPPLPIPMPPTSVVARPIALLPSIPPALPVFSVFSIFDTSLLSFEDGDPLLAPAPSTTSVQDEVYVISKYDTSQTRDIASLQGPRPWSRLRRRNRRLCHYTPPFIPSRSPTVHSTTFPRHHSILLPPTSRGLSAAGFHLIPMACPLLSSSAPTSFHPPQGFR